SRVISFRTTAPRPGRWFEERGYEGMVAKDPPSAYRSGPTRSWVKVKVRHEGVFVVGGIRNVDAFDGVLAGELVDGRLECRGCGGGSGGACSWACRAAPPPFPRADVAVLRPASDAGGHVDATAAVRQKSPTRRSLAVAFAHHRGVAW